MVKAHVVVTRPMAQGDGLAEQLSSAGYSVCQLPMLDILPLQQPQAIAQAKNQLSSLERFGLEPADVMLAESDVSQQCFDLAIFISTNAVKHAARFCREQDVSWPSTLPCLGMGSATKKTIAEQGWQLLDTGDEAPQCATSALEALRDGTRDETTESLLQGAWLDTVEHRRIAIIRGMGGRELLAEQLRAQHIDVEYIEVYERHMPQYDSQALRDSFKPLFNDIFDDVNENAEVSAALMPALPILLFASGETLLNFCRAIEPLSGEYQFTAAHCVVPSDRVASIARSQGFRRVNVAEGASDQAFLHAVLALDE